MLLRYVQFTLLEYSTLRGNNIIQVLSESVSKALQLIQGGQAGETAKLVDHMDKFFDALNVSNFTEGKKNRKPFQTPYRSDTDFRLTVSTM